MHLLILIALGTGVLGGAVGWISVRSRRPVAGRAMPAQQSDPVVLDGKPFVRMAEGTVEWDGYVVSQLAAAGLLTAPTIGREETWAGFAQQTLVKLLASGRLPELLGGLLLPASLKPTDWTSEIAADTARIVRAAAGEDRIKVHNLTTQVLIDFFASGIASALISPTYSPPRVAAQRGIDPLLSRALSSHGLANGATSSAG